MIEGEEAYEGGGAPCVEGWTSWRGLVRAWYGLGTGLKVWASLGMGTARIRSAAVSGLSE